VLAKHTPPRLFVPELKAERGQPTLDQVHWMTLLTANGVYSEVWRPSDRDMIAELLQR
jgi:hypothetical protein